jgi:transcriptional regulator with XRE-family HTH domain
MKSPLRKVRERKGQTITEVGRAVTVDPGNLSRIENCKQKASTELAEKLAKHFNNEITEMEILYPDRFIDPDTPNPA